MGPATGEQARVRLDELRASARRLRADRVVHLGYADSGHGPLLYADPPDRVRFARADPGEAAARLARLIRDEHADVLLSYDPNGGYGHRDHVKVHRVGARAAELARTPRAYESTMNRDYIRSLIEDRRDDFPEAGEAPDPAQMDDFGSPAMPESW